MLSSWSGMFQHLWSLPISMSLTRPNHRTNNQVRRILTPHTHTHNTQIHTQTTHVYHASHIHTCNTCIPHFTHTHTGTIQRHTTPCISHTYRHTYRTCIHTLHTHTHTRTDWFLLEDRDPVFLVSISQSMPQAGPGTW